MDKISPISFDAIYDISGGKPEFLAKLFQVLKRNLEEYPNMLAELLQENKLDELGSQAHKFKSSTAYLAYDELDVALSTIEAYAEQGLDQASLAKQLEIVNRCVSLALPEVEAELQKVSS